MKRSLLIIIISVLLTGISKAQPSDYISIKGRHEKTLKTYYQGSYMLAETNDGMILSGYIKDIKNDSIRFQQRETRLMQTAFGTKVDTFAYTIQFHYKILRRFMWGKKYKDQKPHGRTVLNIPNLMVVGGVAYIGLELVNTMLSKQSISERKSLPSLIVAAISSTTGWVINKIQYQRDRVGGRYNIEYIKSGSIINKE